MHTKRIIAVLTLLCCVALGMLMPPDARAGGTIALPVSSVVGTRGAASASLTQYSADVRQFQCVNCVSGDSVRVDGSNDGVTWLTVLTFSGSQAAWTRLNDRSAYYSTVRLSTSGATVRVVVSVGSDPNLSAPVVIRSAIPTISASNATCVPLWGASANDVLINGIYYYPNADVAADASNYLTVTLFVYDSGGTLFSTLETWDSGFTGFALVGHAPNATNLTSQVLVPSLFSVCVTYTKHGTGGLPSGSLEFVTQ